jgi:hypothetical protein
MAVGSPVFMQEHIENSTKEYKPDIKEFMTNRQSQNCPGNFSATPPFTMAGLDPATQQGRVRALKTLRSLSLALGGRIKCGHGDVRE